MDQVKVLDKTFKKSISQEQIMESVARIAADLDRDLFGKDPVFLAVLNGAFMFASDLFRMVQMPCSISFVKMASYSGEESTGQVKELIGLTEDLTGKDIVIVEDIIDTGLTMEVLLKKISEKNPASVRIASLLFKPEAFQANFKIHHIGLSIPNDFIVGYGLDYDGFGRNLRDIYTVIP